MRPANRGSELHDRINPEGPPTKRRYSGGRAILHGSHRPAQREQRFPDQVFRASTGKKTWGCCLVSTTCPSLKKRKKNYRPTVSLATLEPIINTSPLPNPVASRQKRSTRSRNTKLLPRHLPLPSYRWAARGNPSLSPLPSPPTLFLHPTQSATKYIQ